MKIALQNIIDDVSRILDNAVYDSYYKLIKPLADNNGMIDTSSKEFRKLTKNFINNKKSDYQYDDIQMELGKYLSESKPVIEAYVGEKDYEWALDRAAYVQNILNTVSGLTEEEITVLENELNDMLNIIEQYESNESPTWDHIMDLIKNLEDLKMMEGFVKPSVENKLQEATEAELDELAEYLYNEAEVNRDKQITYFPDYDEVISNYDDTITEEQYNTIAKKVKDVLQSVKFYNSDGNVLLELNDNHTLYDVKNDDVGDSLYSMTVEQYLNYFEEETGVTVYTEGRMGRHICIDNTWDNAQKYNELKNKQKELEKDMVDYLNNYRIEEAKKVQEAETGTDAAVKAIKSFYKDGNKDAIDLDWLVNEVELQLNNVESLTNGMLNTRRPAHSPAYDALVTALNQRSDVPLSSRQIQAGFKKLGLDYKKVLEPVVEYVEEQREEMKEESVGDSTTHLVNPPSSIDKVTEFEIDNAELTKPEDLINKYIKIKGNYHKVLDVKKVSDDSYVVTFAQGTNKALGGEFEPATFNEIKNLVTYKEATVKEERFLGPSDAVIADSKAKGLYSEALQEDYKVGDRVKYDGNIMGVNPKIGTGEIIGVSNGVATHGYTKSNKVYKIKGDNGVTFSLDSAAILEKLEDKKTEAVNSDGQVVPETEDILETLKTRKEAIERLIDKYTVLKDERKINALKKNLEDVKREIWNYSNPDKPMKMDGDTVEESIQTSSETMNKLKTFLPQDIDVANIYVVEDGDTIIVKDLSTDKEIAKINNSDINVDDLYELGLVKLSEKKQERNAEEFVKDVEDAKLLGWDGKDDTFNKYMNKVADMRKVNKEIKNEKYTIVNDKNLDAIKDNFTPPGAKDDEDECCEQSKKEESYNSLNYYVKVFKDGVGEIDYREFDDEQEAITFAEQSKKEGNRGVVYSMDNNEALYDYDVNESKKVQESSDYYIKALGVNPYDINYEKNERALSVINKFKQANKLDSLFDYLVSGVTEPFDTEQDYLNYVADTDISDYETYNGKLTEADNEKEETEEERDKRIFDELANQEEEKNLYDLLVDRVGQQLSVGEFNTILQSLFARYNETFLLRSELYNMDMEEPQELVIFDDDDMYTLTYDIIDMDEGIIELTDVDVE